MTLQTEEECRKPTERRNFATEETQ